MKKIQLSLYLFVLAAAIFTVSSCKKIAEGVNIDPNNPTDAPYPLVLNGAQVSSILVYEGNLARTAGMFAQSFTGVDRQYVSVYNYNTSAGDYNDVWDNLYSIVIAQALIVKQKAQEVNDRTTIGISEVMLAQAFGTAADLWGDVPFSEAGDPDRFPTPKFDPQLDVYAGVQKLLDSAIVNLSANVGAGPGSKDIFYNGSKSKWIAAANTLKARFYLHTKEYNKAILAAQSGISSAANNMMAPHGSSYGIDFNVYYSFLTYDRPGYMNSENAMVPKYLDPDSDIYKGNAKTDETARFEYFFQPELNTGGLDPNVLVDFDWGNDPDENGVFGATTSFPLVTYEENQLILAESYIKGEHDLPSALAALNAHRDYMNTGDRISPAYQADGLLYDPYVLTDFDAGGIANPGTLTPEEALLTEILKEKYVTMFGQIEQFNDVRRTKNFLNIPPVRGTVLPQRLLYAQDEINTNPNTPVLTAADLFTPTPANTTPY